MLDLAATLRTGSKLAARFGYTMGTTTEALHPERTIPELARILGEHRVAYAIIGGVAAQVWRKDPRTTLDIDVAVRSYEDLPRAALEAAGFTRGERHAHSENWMAPDGSPVQFSDDVAFSRAIDEAVQLTLAGAVVQMISAANLVRAKLRAARDPGRRRSKHFQDLADIAALVEDHPELRTELTDEEVREVDAVG